MLTNPRTQTIVPTGSNYCCWLHHTGAGTQTNELKLLHLQALIIVVGCIILEQKLTNPRTQTITTIGSNYCCRLHHTGAGTQTNELKLLHPQARIIVVGCIALELELANPQTIMPTGSNYCCWLYYTGAETHEPTNSNYYAYRLELLLLVASRW
ncbi:hypothetical protein IUY40_19220, partial [Flavobacterium sp. ALJ2]|uniref:hypothetical protein n=1 Tax=Flavobacterium sp. ALJ2 TaxID=2786960 RepID=UPI00189E300F